MRWARGPAPCARWCSRSRAVDRSTTGRVTTPIHTAISPPTQLVAALNSTTDRDASAASRRVSEVVVKPAADSTRASSRRARLPVAAYRTVPNSTSTVQRRPIPANTRPVPGRSGGATRRLATAERAARTAPTQASATASALSSPIPARPHSMVATPRTRPASMMEVSAQDTIRAGGRSAEPGSRGRVRRNPPKRLKPPAGRPPAMPFGERKPLKSPSPRNGVTPALVR